MATSWEAYKKKRKQSDKSSSSSWNSYVASREADKLTRNEISPLAKVVKEDIAPVKKETEKRKWFESGAFSDGYQFGDITKTILGTTTDVQQDLTKGILRIGEGLVDTVAYGVGGIADLIGQDGFANKTKEFIAKDYVEDSKIANRMINNSKTGSINNLLNGNYGALNPFNTDKANDDTYIEGNSLLGDKSDSLVQSGGQLAGTIGLQALGVPWWVTTGTTSFGSGTQEAFQSDASYGEAGAYGLISAGAEVLTEKLSGGISFGGKTLDDVLLKPLTDKIANKTLKTLTKFGLDAVGEGTEEVLTEIIQNVGQKLTYEDEKTWSELLTSEEAMDQYLESFIGGAVLGGGSSVVNSIQEHSNNKAPVEKTAQADNTAQVEGLQQAIEAKQQELSQSQDVREQQIIQEEIDNLNQELNEATNAQKITNESDLRKRNYVYQAQETDSDIKKAVYESASQVMNNTEKSRKLVEVVAKIAEEKGTTYKFTNNEQLKQLGYVKENVTVNGLVNENGEVLINIDSAKALNTVVGHETTHLLEGTKEYDALKQVAIEYAKSKGDYDTKMAQLHSLYKDTNANLENELVSDIVGDYLFTDDNFIKELSVKQPTLFEKIKNFISDLVVKFKGTDQEKQLRQLQRSFEKAYKAQGTQTTDTKYLLTAVSQEQRVEAENLEKLNKSADEIYLETGVYRGADDRWRREIDDSNSKITLEQPDMVREGDTYELKEILKHPELYKAYPELKNVIVKFAKVEGYSGMFNPNNNTIELDMSLINTQENSKKRINNVLTMIKENDPNILFLYSEEDIKILEKKYKEELKAHKPNKYQHELKSTLMHEIQHWIQKRHGFAKGSNVETRKEATKRYREHLGEISKELQKYYDEIGTGEWIDKNIKRVQNNEITIDQFFKEQEEFKLNSKYGERIAELLNESAEYQRKYGVYERDALDLYKNTAGEIEAREVQKRIDYTKEQRQTEMPFVKDENTVYTEPSLNYRNGIIKYSLSEDTQGRKLSDNQKEYFKNVIPELKDENGNLKVLYHGTPNEFTQFNYDFIGSNGTALGKGFYLTDDRTVAEGYGNVMEVYANITKPMLYQERSMTKAEYKKFVEAVDKATEGQFLSDYGEVDYEGYNTVLNRALEDYSYGGDDIDLVHGVLNTAGLTWEEGFRILKDTIGYDGVVSKKGFLSKEGTVYIPTLPEQIKSIDNQSPTDNPDINLSLSAQNEEIAPIGNWNVRGEDVRLQVEEAITPLQETITKLTEQVKTLQENVAPVVEQVKPEQVMQSTKPTLEEVKNLMDIKDNKSGSEYASAFYALRDKYGQVNLYKSLNEYYATGTVTDEDFTAPTSQDIVEQQGQEAFDTITDEHAPSFEDTVEDAMWNEEFESTSTENIPSPFDTRDIDEVGNRKVKAYQYENPEVRPYFQQEAQNMMWDLNNTIKGERSFNDQLYYDSNGEQGFFGTTRQTTEAIAYLKDKYGYSYAQIEKGLNDIIEDNGKENNAVAKRIEFMLDERLREGYTTSDGIPIPPNEEYIKFLEERQITEYNREISSQLTDADAPIEETIEAPIEETPVEALPEPSESFVIDENTKGQLSVPLPETTAQNRNTELADTSTETQEQEKVAQILSERPTQENKKQRTWAKARAAFLDKGSVFEDLSIKTKNRELMAKWDYALTSEARAQNVMMNGTYEYNKATKERTRVGKGLEEIRTEVGDRVQEFSEYLYHKHNVDRMSIESNAQARMAELQETVLKGYDLEGIEALSRKRIPNKTDKKSEQLQFKDVAKQAEVEINAAKEFMRLTEAKNKPVFGNSVTAEISQQKVDEYEMKNPEFMDWANDVYDYNKANLNQLVNGGVISQETADQFAEIYPNYVPIGRADVKGNAVNVPLDTNRTGVNVPIARATGGNSDILPLFDTMAKRTIQTYRAVAKNSFGVELKNTLNSVVDNQQTNVDEILDNVDQQESLLQEGKNGKAPTFTVFENGEKVTYEITEDMFDALKPVSEGLKGNILWGVPNKISSIHRGVLTEYNPVFMLTNAIKDSQDILLNSQHATKTYAKMPEAYAQILRKGYWYQEYMANGGEQNSYFDSQEGSFDTERKGINKILDLPPLKQISQINNVIEMSPRLAEYIASRESGRSVETSMLDAARVTTNFKAGGDITKWANRNGATFLNASIQGAMQQVRNVREAHANGLKGYANLASKFALAGVPAMILNSLLWGDDEDYEELSDYVKQSYWIVGKYGDGNFIRIPKGRMVTVVQEALNQMTNLVTGNDEADLGQFLEIVGNNIAPNNPIENNILSPLIQAVTNKTWYGGDLVPTRLQDVPTEEQYDESTDKLSIAIGQATGISPYKINYVLDQYTGGVGDVFLPMMTQQAEGGKDDLVSNLIAPLTNKFTVDSTMKNQSVTDLYDLSEELTTKANSSKATDEDILRNKYVYSVKSEMNELYKQKREIQNSDISDSQKYNQVREIQDQINTMAKTALNDYDDMITESNYADVGGIEYYKNNEGQWKKINYEKEAKDLNEMNMSVSEKNTYFKTKNEINKIVGIVEDSKDDITIEDEDSEEYKEAIKYLSSEKKEDIVNKVINSGLADNQKAYLYKKYYNTDTIDTIVNASISVDDYLIYTTKEFKADLNSKGNAISGSRKKKVINYINGLEMTIPQKAILIKSTNTFKFNDYNNDIASYVNDLDLEYKDKVKILKKLDMTVDSDGSIYWDN